jgi:hypothetical protein
MKTDDCQAYLEDPEAHPGHLATCEECRALFGSSDEPIGMRAVTLDTLPLAAWEGASHRAWPLVAAAAAAVLVMACALFAVAGVSPLGGIRSSVLSLVPPADVLRLVPQLVGNAAQHAPSGWQILVAISFVVVNTILYLLLRRAPKGIDV